MLEAGGAVIERGLRAIPIVEIDAVVVEAIRTLDAVGAVLVADVEKAPETEDVETVRGGSGEQIVDHGMRYIHGIVVVGTGHAEGNALVIKDSSCAIYKMMAA